MDDAPMFSTIYAADPERRVVFTKDQPTEALAHKRRVTITYAQRRQVEERLKQVVTVVGDPADQMCKYAPGFGDVRVADEMPFSCSASSVESVRRAVFGRLFVRRPDTGAPDNEVAALRAEFAAQIAELRAEFAAEIAGQRIDINALTVRLNRLASSLGEPA